MKRSAKGIFLSIVLALGGFSCANAALTKDFYTTASVLSSGNWVKVGVEETGVYEISYEALKKMGFSDPSKVAVYGRGGRVLPESFVSNSGVPVITDDLTAVKVIHEDGMLYFYGLGPEEISYESSSDYATKGYFARKGNNIYSKRGYYFLTDSRDIDKMTERQYSTTSANKCEKGLSYLYHELDSVQNTTMSGQLFWGESVNRPGATKRYWDVEMPDAIPGDGVMHCEMYFQEREFGPDAEVAYGFENSDFFSTKYVQNTSLYYAPHQPTVARIEIPESNSGRVFVSFAGYEMGKFANLDFWVVTYQRNLPTMKDKNGKGINQQLLALPDIEKNTTGKIELENPASLVVLDVTNSATPERLKITQQGNLGIVGVKNSNKTPVIVVFDKDKPQLQIKGYEKDYEKIANQNLHAYKEGGADFIIITVPSLRQYAEEIAQLHRDADGIKVVVATTEECYNEFSAGVPDPMAYRSFAKMLNFSGCKPKNMLLLGPLYSDFRGLQSERNPLEGIIAYQSPQVSTTRGAHNINDFYGVMSDKFRTDYYERNEVSIGVAILPVAFESEAKIVVDKIRSYLSRTDHAYYLNRYTAIGGILDEHTHEIQVRDICNYIRNLDYKGTISTPIPIDTYGNSEAQKKFFNQLNEGCNLFSYFGHGAEQFLGKDRNFFNAGDVFKLRNSVLPLGLFGGCQITNTDRGFRGLGETLVTSTPYGCIGTVVSARDTWSGQNYEFFKQFLICMYTSGSTTAAAHRSQPVTVGEIYAAVKNYSTYSNELAYQLLCDPAIVFPVINGSVKVEASEEDEIILLPGDRFKIKGSITKADGTKDSNFNGELVIRLCEPEKKVPAGNIITNEDTKGLEFTYRDNQVSMAVTEVKGGVFNADIHVPSLMTDFTGGKAIIYACAYDPSRKIGAASGTEVEVGTNNVNSAESSDNINPVIEELSFDNAKCELALTVSDNFALNMSNNPLSKGLYLFIDGKERTEAHFIEPMIEKDKVAFSKYIPLDGLAYGDHTARLKVKDAAGNATEAEITFTYSPLSSLYSIIRSEESGPDFTRIQVEGVVPANADIVILSDNGTEIWEGQLDGSSYVDWDHTFNGSKVNPGHYKAYLIETGSSSMKGHSETIDIPVI